MEDRFSKQTKMLKKYHTKFEEIKTSAKEKDRARRAKAEKEGSGGDDPAIGIPDVS